MKNKLLPFFLLAALVTSSVGCKKYLNINSDPDTPQDPSNQGVITPVLASMPYGIQRDARYIAKYIQNWNGSAAADAYDAHGYTFIDNNMGDMWWTGYYQFGQNVIYMEESGIQRDQPDFVGAALALRAWAFLQLVEQHDYIIFKEAWVEGIYYFKYDSAEVVYPGIDSMCRKAIRYFEQAQARPANTLTLPAGDIIYGGDINKWKKFVYGLMARAYNHQSLKSFYQPDSVLKYSTLAMEVAAEDFVVPFDATTNDNSNFWGTFRNNLAGVKQSNYIVKLLDGTTLAGGTQGHLRDPRMPHMLSASQDTATGNGGYRGVTANNGDPYVGLTGTYAVNSTNWANARRRVAAVWGDSIYGNPSSAVFNPGVGKYLYADKAPMPVMTSAEMLFIKAEAAYKKGEKATAFTAYRAGIERHFDMINRSYSSLRGARDLYKGNPISAAARTAYLNGPNVKQNANDLRMYDILAQKYIALWGWGFMETWTDLRRYHYVDIDPETTEQYYKGFAMPVSYASTNQNKPAYRIRPNYRSENSYNFLELQRIGATAQSWHTGLAWIARP